MGQQDQSGEGCFVFQPDVEELLTSRSVQLLGKDLYGSMNTGMYYSENAALGSVQIQVR